MANLFRREFTGTAGQVNSMSSSCNSDVRAGVDEQHRGSAQILQDAAGKNGKLCRRQILLAQLDHIDASRAPAGGLFNQRGLLVALVAGK